MKSQINIEQLNILLVEGRVGDAFMLCKNYVIGCLHKQGWASRLYSLSLDEMLSEAYIAFDYSAKNFDVSRGYPFLKYFYVHLKSHMFYTWLRSGLINITNSYRTSKKIEFINIEYFQPSCAEEQENESNIREDTIPDTEDTIKTLMDLDQLGKMLQTLPPKFQRILYNPYEHPTNYFIDDTITNGRSVIQTRVNALKKLKKIACNY